jgi:hypothetical protein
MLEKAFWRPHHLLRSPFAPYEVPLDAFASAVCSTALGSCVGSTEQPWPRKHSGFAARTVQWWGKLASVGSLGRQRRGRSNFLVHPLPDQVLEGLHHNAREGSQGRVREKRKML